MVRYVKPVSAKIVINQLGLEGKKKHATSAKRGKAHENQATASLVSLLIGLQDTMCALIGQMETLHGELNKFESSRRVLTVSVNFHSFGGKMSALAFLTN